MTGADIQILAAEFSVAGKKWHFHLLSPDCQLNSSGKHQLILENTTENREYTVTSDQPFMGVGESLVKLLHGADVVKGRQELTSTPPSPQVQILLRRAVELRKQGIFWHHHMLFPGCKYNRHGQKWVIMFEDRETGKTIESLSDTEPKSDLRHIEGLFYSQGK